MGSLVFSEAGVICSVPPAEGSLPKLIKISVGTDSSHTGCLMVESPW